MSTAKKTGKPSNKTVTKAVEKSPTAEATTKTITVAKKDKKFAGARVAWYSALLAHDGQTNTAFVDSCTKTPPATKSGKVEDPRGWLRFFVRTGVATLA